MVSRRKRIKRSQKQEKEGMDRFGGQVHKGSGNQWDKKGDGRTTNHDDWREHQLIEFKRTDKRQITIKADDLEKLSNEALAEGRVPVLAFSVGGRDYVIQEEDDYIERRGVASGRELGDGEM